MLPLNPDERALRPRSAPWHPNRPTYRTAQADHPFEHCKPALEGFAPTLELAPRPQPAASDVHPFPVGDERAPTVALMEPDFPEERTEPWRSKTWIARYFDVSVRTVERWLAGGCPSRLLGGVRRMRLSDVDAYLERMAA